MINKILRLIICFSMLQLLAGCSNKKMTDIDFFEYEINEKSGTVIITKYTGPDAEVIIPDEIEKRTVTVIGEEAFEDNEVIDTVIIPDSVIEIQRGAFARSSLKHVELPDKLEILGYCAFYSVDVEEVDLPSSLTKIKSYNFEPEKTVLSFEKTNSVILEYAMNNNFTYVVDGKRHDRVDEITAIIQKAEKYINDNEYDKVVSLLKSESDVIGNSVYYYQKNKLVDDMTDGKALILQKNGVYTGEIKNDKKNGQGKQLGIYSDDYSYTVSDGSWKNGKLNGEAIYYEPNIAVSSSKSEDKVDFTYKGNFTENYYDGVISATWESESGIYEAKFTADMGNITVLREENGKYIYLDDGKGYYWYFEDPTALQGWIVWAGQDSK